MTKIISYNVNGIRAAEKKGLSQWIATQDFDLLCFQEVKASKEQAPLQAFEQIGYTHCHWHDAEKKGYSGVAVFSKQAPDQVVIGCGMDKYDREGRIMRLDFGDWSILNCYFPSGTSGDIRQDFKYEFLDDFFDWIKKLKRKRKKLIVVGDYNIAHTEMDIHNPKSNKNSSGFLPEERAWMSKWFDSGFTDSFRYLHPEKVEYSWWSYRANARANNKGWRIDYQSVSNNLKGKIRQAHHLPEAKHSDHCPVFLEIDL
ncbi:MAG TPA: exodeoxyribonuclease III [Phaeodactylibacter sp.]|nr:exodeoxyribonuclease III [Phaeodactylibacter sp.]